MKTELAAKLITITKNVLDERGLTNDVDKDLPLNEQGVGLDSIGRLTLLSQIEKELNIEFPEKYWGSESFTSLADIIVFLTQKANI